MHDPSTVAHEIKYPWWRSKPWPTGVKRWEDMTPAQQAGRSPHWRDGWRDTFITVWHEDPETDGTDDSCGWFPRSRHGSRDVLKKIISRFEFDWDRTWTSDSGHVYHSGYFKPDGSPVFSVAGITVDLFHTAAGVVYAKGDGFNHRRAERFMRRHLPAILRFAENPTDSLHDGITRKFETGCGEEYTAERRQDRIESMASTIYGWILRADRPWYRHPKWHVHHWRLQVHPLQAFKRWAFSRCATCGKRFPWGYSPMAGWHSTGPRWFRGESGVRHHECADPAGCPAGVGT
jgi:hypothetical protein